MEGDGKELLGRTGVAGQCHAVPRHRRMVNQQSWDSYGMLDGYGLFFGGILYGFIDGIRWIRMEVYGFKWNYVELKGIVWIEL